MPEPDEDAADSQVESRLAAVAEGTDGVERLQPTLRHAVADVASRLAGRASDDLADLIRPGSPGIDVQRGADGRVDVVIDISTWSDQPALGVCRELRDAVRGELRILGLPEGKINITVLGVTRAQ